MLLVDGIERLNWLNRRLLLSQFSNRVPGGRAGQGDGCPGDGLIVTSHRAVGGLPIIFQTSFDAALLDRIVKKLMQLNGDNDIDKALLAESPGWQWESISWESISCDLLARHGENGRAILMDLYDLYQSNSINQHPEKKPLSFARGKN